MNALATWHDSDSRRTIVAFVDRTVAAGVPVEERVAVFDNDGTLWCEKPVPIQADMSASASAFGSGCTRSGCERAYFSTG